MQVLLSDADRAVGRLDATTELLPNPDLFVMMYVRKEAVDFSRIEGTQASLTDLLEYNVRGGQRNPGGGIRGLVEKILTPGLLVVSQLAHQVAAGVEIERLRMPYQTHARLCG